MKVLFIGSTQFSYSICRFLLGRNDTELIGIVTKRKSLFNSDFCSLEPVTLRANIPCFFSNQENCHEMIPWAQRLKPDVIYCFGWSDLLSEELIRIPPLGTIGYHPTKLPKYRGRHPIIWTLALGLTETASTFFFIDGGIDSGDILHQRIVKVEPDDDATTLYEKLIRTALEQIDEFTPRLITHTAVRIPQNETMASYWRKREKKDGQIDWRMSAQTIHNLVRALAKPYGGASCFFGGREIKIWKSAVVNSSEQGVEPGKVLTVANGHIYIKCLESVLKLLVHEFENLPGEGTFL